MLPRTRRVVVQEGPRQLADAERAIQMLAGEIAGETSIHSCLLPDALPA